MLREGIAHAFQGFHEALLLVGYREIKQAKLNEV